MRPGGESCTHCNQEVIWSHESCDQSTHVIGHSIMQGHVHTHNQS